MSWRSAVCYVKPMDDMKGNCLKFKAAGTTEVTTEVTAIETRHMSQGISTFDLEGLWLRSYMETPELELVWLLLLLSLLVWFWLWLWLLLLRDFPPPLPPMVSCAATLSMSPPASSIWFDVDVVVVVVVVVLVVVVVVDVVVVGKIKGSQCASIGHGAPCKCWQ